MSKREAIELIDRLIIGATHAIADLKKLRTMSLEDMRKHRYDLTQELSPYHILVRLTESLKEPDPKPEPVDPNGDRHVQIRRLRPDRMLPTQQQLRLTEG